MREDYAIAGSSSIRRIVTDDLRNPLGTRAGEVIVWKKLRLIVPDIEFGTLF
jgi:hypothetical protein